MEWGLACGLSSTGIDHRLGLIVVMQGRSQWSGRSGFDLTTFYKAHALF